MRRVRRNRRVFWSGRKRGAPDLAGISLFAGTGILLYIIAAALMPKANEPEKDLQEVVQPEGSGINASSITRNMG